MVIEKNASSLLLPNLTRTRRLFLKNKNWKLQWLCGNKLLKTDIFNVKIILPNSSFPAKKSGILGVFQLFQMRDKNVVTYVDISF